MTNSWRSLKLGQILSKSQEWIDLKPDRQYKQVTVRLWGKGVVLRGISSGAEITVDRQAVVRKNQLILSRIDARNGALGIVPNSLDGAVVSNDFPVFNVNRSLALPEYLGWLTKTKTFVDLCKGASEGTTNRIRLQEDRFLAAIAQLPPVDEQRRIVCGIEDLFSKIQEAHRLRQQAREETAVIYQQTRDQIFRQLTSERKPIRELFDLINGRAFKPYEWEEAGREIIRIQNLKYTDAAYNRYSGPVDPKHLVHAGDVLFAWSGQVVSLGAHVWQGEEAILNQHIFNVRSKTEFLPEFVKEGFNSLIDEMKEQVRGLEMFHIRKQELDKLRFPKPPLEEQRRIVAHLDGFQGKVDSLRKIQEETAEELSALMPSILSKAFAGEL